MADATAPRTLLMLAPVSLANYERCLRLGFEETLRRDHRPDPIVTDVKSVVVGEHEDVAVAVREAMAAVASTCRVVLVQLHGAHNERAVAFDVFKQLSMFTTITIVLLVHRPEEVLERAWRALYDEAATLAMLRWADAVVLLGEAMIDAYAHLCRRVCAIHHGFFNLVSPEKIVDKAQMTDIATIGSVTTWSDMRWVSDVLTMHAAYQASTTWRTEARILFYVAGTFRPYTRINDTRSVDELALLRSGVASESVVVIEGEDIDRAFTGGAFADLASFRLWLWQLSSEGRKVIVVGSPQPAQSEVLALQADLIDFNVQLYRELLRDFAPKVEYSGTLHERAGSSIPVVFDSPSMHDVAKEGLQCLTIAYTPRDQTDHAPIEPDPSNALFYPSHYYPDFGPCLGAIVEYILNPQRYQTACKANAQAAQRQSFERVASEYLQLLESLRR